MAPCTAASIRRQATSTRAEGTLICMHSTVRSSSAQQSEQSVADGSPGPGARRAAVRPCRRARGAMCSGAAWHGTDLVERRLVVVERPRLLAASGFVSAAAWRSCAFALASPFIRSSLSLRCGTDRAAEHSVCNFAQKGSECVGSASKNEQARGDRAESRRAKVLQADEE